MTKAELIDKIASGAGLSKTDAAKALDSTLNAIKLSLKKGQKVTLVGFGGPSTVKHKARKGVIPRQGRLSIFRLQERRNLYRAKRLKMQ